MVRYLLIFFEPHQTLNEGFFLWRKEILAGWAAFSPLLYLDADDPISETNKYRHVNIYHANDDSFPALSRIEEHLQQHLDNGPSVSYHWQLHDEIREIRQSSRTTATVVTVGMTIPSDQETVQELTDWYDQEHMPRLATVPGWLAGIRMRLAHSSDEHDASAAAYLALHQWGDPNGLGGDIWKTAVMTPWTERISALHTAPVHRRVWKISD
ncbi:hypothetical protein BDV30DRAFT_243634 [Aspergillus minisclerotigenes]|uniref:EthD domain-containing protein n=1 Tax=Aspergillus minisclerotigenes TaxID=656917 RepID=A0A5N6IN73_9EURO|nr:hypothetical protein BDV30DRAFT_243634 [Aspergillus minisclerotigenes]